MIMTETIKDFVFRGKSPSGNNKAKTVIVLTTKLEARNDKAPTVSKLVEKCKERGIKCVVIDTSSGEIEKTISGLFIIGDKRGKRTEVDINNSVVLARRSAIESTAAIKFFQKLESLGFISINSLKSVMLCEDKLDTVEALQERGIPVPKTALVSSEDDIDNAVNKIGGGFPLVVKLLNGTKGIGVFQIDSHASLVSTLQAIWKLSPETELILQEKIPAEYDLRIHVLGSKDGPDEGFNYRIIGAMRRNKIEGDFRTNFSLGGETEKIELSEEVQKIALESAKCTGCSWCGVDIIVSSDEKRPYVLEVNASPGTSGIEKTTEIPITDLVLDFITERKNWNYPTKLIGFRESFVIRGVGEFVGKSDTGNGAISCSVHADYFEEVDGFMNWTIGGKSFSHRVVEYSKAEVGSNVEKRPVILLDIEFDGTVYRNVKFSLVDRTSKSTPLLLNRSFMEQAGLVVDPSRTFLASSMPNDYSPSRAKGDAIAGIDIS